MPDTQSFTIMPSCRAVRNRHNGDRAGSKEEDCIDFYFETPHQRRGIIRSRKVPSARPPQLTSPSSVHTSKLRQKPDSASKESSQPPTADLRSRSAEPSLDPLTSSNSGDEVRTSSVPSTFTAQSAEEYESEYEPQDVISNVSTPSAGRCDSAATDCSTLTPVTTDNEDKIPVHQTFARFNANPHNKWRVASLTPDLSAYIMGDVRTALPIN